MPQSLGLKLAQAGFRNVRAESITQVETVYDPSSVSAIMIQFMMGYLVSQGASQSEVDDWAADLRAMGARGDYFFSSNEYMFIADKP